MRERFPRQNLYTVIGLPDFAPIEEVRKKYRELAMKHHPDRGGKKENMQALNNIYEILTKTKEEYDNFLRSIIQPVSFVKVVVNGSWAYTNYYTSNSTTWTTY